MSNEKPDPSWSAEKMAKYMEEKYGKDRFKDARTEQSIPWDQVVKLFDDKQKR